MDSPILPLMVFEPMTIFLAFSDASDPDRPIMILPQLHQILHFSVHVYLNDYQAPAPDSP